MYRSLLRIATTLALASPALAGGAPAVPVSSFDHSEYDRILGSVVVDESVDYLLLREEHLSSLDQYLESMAEVDPSGMSRPDQLALYINLYNATVLGAVTRRYEPGYSASENDFGLFDEPLVRVTGRKITLNDLEHGLIRKQFDEPRIHVALVCAARSCPPLVGHAYVGTSLDAALEQRMRAFVGDGERNRIDPARRQLELSRIFEWYAEDFGGREKLAAFVNRYTKHDVESYSVGFSDYSWELNDVAR